MRCGNFDWQGRTTRLRDRHELLFENAESAEQIAETAERILRELRVCLRDLRVSKPRFTAVADTSHGLPANLVTPAKAL
jgi:hypothetical protein